MPGSPFYLGCALVGFVNQYLWHPFDGDGEGNDGVVHGAVGRVPGAAHSALGADEAAAWSQGYETFYI